MRGIHTPLRHPTGTCSRAQGSNGLRTATVLGVEGGGRGEGGGDTHTDSRHEDVRARNSKFELLVRQNRFGHERPQLPPDPEVDALVSELEQIAVRTPKEKADDERAEARRGLIVCRQIHEECSSR